MAKETNPPTPIPIGDDMPRSTDDLYCASYVNNSAGSFSMTSIGLLEYLEATYSNSDMGGSTRSFMACFTTKEDVKRDILNAGIYGINENTIDRHVLLEEQDSDVLIFVNLY